MAKEIFERKPLCNIAVIGDDSLKSYLCAAITTTYPATKSNEIDKEPEEKERSIVINYNQIQFSTVDRSYSAITYSLNDKFFITSDIQLDGIILVVEAGMGLSSQVCNQLQVAYKYGVTKVVLFVDKCAGIEDNDIIELTVCEARDLLSEYGFDGIDTPYIYGSSARALYGEQEWQEKIKELMDYCDSVFPLQRDVDKPFLLPIEDVFTVTNRGVVVSGRIEKGKVNPGNLVECVGFGESTEYKVNSIEIFRKLMDEACAGDNVGICLENAEKSNLARGMVLAAPGTAKAYTKFKADIYVYTKEEGGNSTSFSNGYRPQFYFRTTGITGTIQLPQDIELGNPGDVLSIEVELISPVVMEKGLHFSIREGGRTIGCGVVSEINLDEYDESASIPLDFNAISQVKVDEYDVKKEYDSLLGNIPAYFPLALFPVRLETSFYYRDKGDNTKQKQLRVRIIPDEIMLDYKANSKLTKEEIEDGKFFWIQWYIASGCEHREYEAWENLCTKYPLYKAARICRELKPTDFEKFKKKGDVFYHRRPYANNVNVENNGDNLQEKSNIEFIESKCREIYDILSKVNFDEKQFLQDVNSDQETSFENIVRENLSKINNFVFSIESLLLPCEKIVDYLYDNVHETFLYLYRRLQALYSIYQKQPCLSTPRSLEIWDVDFAVLKALLEKTEQFLESLDNRRVTLADMVKLYEPKINFPNVESAKSNALNIPVCKCLPDYFIFVGEVANKEKKVIFAKSEKVNVAKIQMGFSNTKPNEKNSGLDSDNGELDLVDNPNMRWMTDYETARQCGMAITVDLTNDIHEFRYIYVFGVDYKNDNSKKNDYKDYNDRLSVINDLVYGHNYVNSNMRIVNAGTPTNIVDGKFEDDEEYLKRARYEIEVKEIYKDSKKFPNNYPYGGTFKFNYCDSMKIAYLLGCGSESNIYESKFLNTWAHIVDFDSAQDHYAEIAYTALWNEYFKNIEDVFTGSFVKNFFVKHVRARGNFATIRVDNLPYGILPTSDFIQMCKLTLNDKDCSVNLKKLLQSLIQLAEKWKNCRNTNVKYSEKLSGKSVESQKKYLEMVGQTPYSVSFSERTLMDSQFNPSYLDADTTSNQNEKNVKNLSIIRYFLKEDYLRDVPVADVYDAFENKNSELLKKMKDCACNALQNAGMPVGDCQKESELYVSEFLDLFTYRLDAWFMGILDYCFYNKVRSIHSPYLGAFGWVFNLQENTTRKEITDDNRKNILENMGLNKVGNIYESAQDGHFIVAPSIQHALTAAVLRSSYIRDNAQKRSDSQTCVNLSSTRVRQALRLVDGVKSGMSLSVILGSDFERYLHEANKIYKKLVKEKGKEIEIGVEMDEFIYPLRQLFPQVVNLEAGDNRANDYVMQVVNGEALVNSFIEQWAWSGSASGWLENAWNVKNTSCALIERLIIGVDKYGLNTDNFDVLFKIIERLMDSYDALNDLLLSEGVHRLIMGDQSSYLAISNFFNKDGDGNLPNMEVLNIPSEHVVVSHKAGVLLPQVIEPVDKVLCKAEPALNAWIENQLGGMENIVFFVKKENEKSCDIKICSLADLNVRGIEYMYLSAFDKSFHAYLESRYRESIPFCSDKITILDSSIDADIACPNGKISLEDNNLRIEAIRGLVGRGRAMNTADWDNQVCEDKTEEELIDIEDLKKRLSCSHANLEYLKNDLENWLTETKYDTFFNDPENSEKSTNAINDELVARGCKLLCDCFETGMINCVVDYNESAFMGSVTQTSNILRYEEICEAQKTLGQNVFNAYKDLCERMDAAQEAVKSDSSAEAYVAALQTITLSNFKVCYKFKTELVRNNFANPLKEGVKYYKGNNIDAAAFDQWQDEISEVREGMKLMHQLHMTQLALDCELDNVAILQSPTPDGSSATDIEKKSRIWMGAAVNYESELRDADSLVLYNSSAYTTGMDSLSGFVFDSWIEYIPYKKHDAGLAFHNDWPNNEAPQSILVALHPRLPIIKRTNEVAWDVKTLLQVIRTTRFMMMNRALEPDYIYKDPALSKIFPLTPKTAKEEIKA